MYVVKCQDPDFTQFVDFMKICLRRLLDTRFVVENGDIYTISYRIG